MSDYDQPSSDGFPEGFLDQRFERWASSRRQIISALQRAYHQRFSISAKASPSKPVKTGYAILGASSPGRKTAGLVTLAGKPRERGCVVA